MADPDEIAVDVAGQPNGPTPEEQAMVDAEQLEIIAAQRARMAPIEEAARRLLQEKLDKASEDRMTLIDLVRSHEARLRVLESKP